MKRSTQAARIWRAPVALSPSHAHLTSGVIEQLFCDHYRLHHCAPAGLTQYAALESVSLIGPNGRLIEVRVIGPARKINEVELTQSDALKLGINAPERAPGDHAGTPGILIKGPRTQVAIERGVIRALPHVHMGPQHADRLGLSDGDRVDAVSEPNPRRVLFRNVPVLVSVDYRLELHLDADQGAAAGLAPGDCVRLRAAKRAGPRHNHQSPKG